MCNQAPTVDQAIGPTGVEAESFHTLAGRRQSESYVIQGGQYWTPLGQSCRTLETPEHCSLRQAARGRPRPVSPRPQAAVRHSGRNVQTLHSFSGTHFRTDFIPPDQWSRRQAKTAFVLIHTPHGARLQARLRALMATRLRSCFDSFSIRSGRARARAGWGGGVGGRPGPGYVSNKRASGCCQVKPPKAQ